MHILCGSYNSPSRSYLYRFGLRISNIYVLADPQYTYLGLYVYVSDGLIKHGCPFLCLSRQYLSGAVESAGMLPKSGFDSFR